MSETEAAELRFCPGFAASCTMHVRGPSHVYSLLALLISNAGTSTQFTGPYCYSLRHVVVVNIGSPSSVSTSFRAMPPFFLPPPLLHVPLSKPRPQLRMNESPPTNWPPLSLIPKLLTPPHAGSFYAIRRPRHTFFEGWYLRLILPNSNNSYAFMFSIEAPGLGTVQLLTPDDALHKHEIPARNGRFFGDRHKFEIGHWAYANAAAGKARYLDGEFDEFVMQGYQLSASSTHGRFKCDTGLVQWGFDYDQLLAWGDRGTTRHTGTWLTEIPIFEPGYQVLMAHGVVKEGYILCDGERVDVAGGVMYAEKTWGRAFPERWWWLQSNGFWDVRDLSVLALGARRIVLGRSESVGIVAVHFAGKLYEFANWNTEVFEWNVARWGNWHVKARSKNGYQVTIQARTEETHVDVLGPSSMGMAFNVRDCTRGVMAVVLKDPAGVVMLDARCDNAQVEVGGEWERDWIERARAMPFWLRGVVNRFTERVITST